MGIFIFWKRLILRTHLKLHEHCLLGYSRKQMLSLDGGFRLFTWDGDRAGPENYEHAMICSQGAMLIPKNGLEHS